MSLNKFTFTLIALVTFSAAVLANSNSTQTFDQDTVLGDAEEFFGSGAEGLADVIEKVFEEKGRQLDISKVAKRRGPQSLVCVMATASYY